MLIHLDPVMMFCIQKQDYQQKSPIEAGAGMRQHYLHKLIMNIQLSAMMVVLFAVTYGLQRMKILNQVQSSTSKM